MLPFFVMRLPAVSRHSVLRLLIHDHILKGCEDQVEISPNLQLQCSCGRR